MSKTRKKKNYNTTGVPIVVNTTHAPSDVLTWEIPGADGNNYKAGESIHTLPGLSAKRDSEPVQCGYCGVKNSEYKNIGINNTDELRTHCVNCGAPLD